MKWHEIRMAADPLSFMDSLTTRPSGLLELRETPVPRLLVWQPEAIAWIFRSDRAMRHPGSRTLRPLLGSKSLIWLDGPRHTAYRGALGPHLRGSSLKSYVDVIARTAQQAIEPLLPGAVIRLPVWARQVTLRIISRILLDDANDELLASFTAWIEHELGSRPRTMAHRYLGNGAPRPDRHLDEMLVRSAKTARDPALAAVLLEAAGPFGRIDDAELRDQLITLLFAGHETTASAIAWTLFWLHRDQDVLGGVLDELAATGSTGEDAGDLPLLEASAYEALRLSPPATLAGNRMPTSDTEFAGRRIPAGTVLTPAVYLAHRHPDRFSEPDRFVPDRFRGRKVPPSQYFPFGGGTRHCLGRELALLEIRVIVTALLRQARVRFLNPRTGKPQLRGAAMAPHHELRIAIDARARVL